MRLLTTVLLVLVAWTAVAVPVAVFVGRFLRAGAGTGSQVSGSASRSWRKVA